MKNTIDNMFFSTTKAAKGLDGIASIVSPETDSDVQGFETTFRQALAAIDDPRSGKDLPKELLEFDPEKIAGMALTQKKLSSDSSVLIGDADLSNQTVIAFAALQGMDAESLKTLFEKPASVKAQMSEAVLADKTLSISDSLVDDFSEMPPGSVEQTVKALEEQGLLPAVQTSGLTEKLSSENASTDSHLLSDVDTGIQKAEEKPILDKEIGHPDSITNNWLNSRVREDSPTSDEVRVTPTPTPAITAKGADLPYTNTKVDSVDSDSDLAAPESLLMGKNSATVSPNERATPDRTDYRGVLDKTSGIDSSELDLIKEVDSKKLNAASTANAMTRTSVETEKLEKPQIEITSGLVNSSGPRKDKGQHLTSSERPIEFEEIQLTKDNKLSNTQAASLQAIKTISEVAPQSQYVNSIAPAKPLTQQANFTSAVPVGEVAALESVVSSSESNAASESLTQPKGLTARVAVDDLPGKLTALVQQRIVNGLKVEGWRYQVHLHPEELGSVEIQMEMIDGRLEARILASNVAARDLLNEHLAKLEESLQNGGIKESMVQVGLEQRQDSKKSFDSSDDNKEAQAELADSEESAKKDTLKSNDGELDLFV